LNIHQKRQNSGTSQSYHFKCKSIWLFPAFSLKFAIVDKQHDGDCHIFFTKIHIHISGMVRDI